MTKLKHPIVLAALLLLVIGVSGLFVGLSLLGAMSGRGAEPAGIAIAAGISAYGALVIVAGLGTLRRQRWAHRLAIVMIAGGLVELGWQSTLLGFDPVTLFGVAVWGIALVLLLLPAVRGAVRVR